MEDRTRTWKEGVNAGLLGAAGVAGWFLLVDYTSGTPLATPNVLGSALLSVLGPAAIYPMLVNVLAYTLFHVAAFVAVGCIVSAIVAASDRTPGVLVGLLLFFVVFEAGFYTLTLLLRGVTGVPQLAWHHIGIANLIAALLMGTYLWRRHPELADRVEGALSARL